MPQMAPLNWLMLFIYFTMIMIFINNMNYFFYNLKAEKKIFKLSFKNINWKWY